MQRKEKSTDFAFNFYIVDFGEKKRKEGRKLNVQRKEKSTDFAFNFYIVDFGEKKMPA